MNTTYVHQQAIEAFKEMHHQGFVNQVWNVLTGQTTALSTLEDAPHYHPQRQYVGLQTVPLQNIVGSLGRGQDFDRGFRPLKKSLRDRWAKIFILAREDRWEPVHLIKVGGQYFVEDGNHRVSVSHYLGRSYIDAEIWEYPVIPTFTLQGRCAHCGLLVPEQL